MGLGWGVSGRSLEFLTALKTKGKSASLRLEICQLWVRGRLTPARPWVWLPRALFLLSFFHSFPHPHSWHPLGPAQCVRSDRGRNEKPWVPFSPPEPPSDLCSVNGTCGFALAQGHVFSPCRGLMHLPFLFRASGTQQFSPTGKYKADGVLETVRLSGKLSRHLWLCLGTVSFHISKSSLRWGWASPPCSPG